MKYIASCSFGKDCLAEAEQTVRKHKVEVQRMQAKLIRLAQESTKRDWVPADERLPACGEPVLITYIGYIDGKQYSDGVAKYDLSANGYNGGWIWTLDGGDVEVAVTHWMPLPGAPKEEQSCD